MCVREGGFFFFLGSGLGTLSSLESYRRWAVRERHGVFLCLMTLMLAYNNEAHAVGTASAENTLRSWPPSLSLSLSQYCGHIPSSPSGDSSSCRSATRSQTTGLDPTAAAARVLTSLSGPPRTGISCRDVTAETTDRDAHRRPRRRCRPLGSRGGGVNRPCVVNITAHLRTNWVGTDHVTVAPVLNRRFGCASVTSAQPLQPGWQRDRYDFLSALTAGTLYDGVINGNGAADAEGRRRGAKGPPAPG